MTRLLASSPLLMPQEASATAAQQQPGQHRVMVRCWTSDDLPVEQDTGLRPWDASLIATTHHRRLAAGHDPFYLGIRSSRLPAQRAWTAGAAQSPLSAQPACWSRDLGEMRAVGIGLLRTGVWTTWHEAWLRRGVAAGPCCVRSMRLC